MPLKCAYLDWQQQCGIPGEEGQLWLVSDGGRRFALQPRFSGLALFWHRHRGFAGINRNRRLRRKEKTRPFFFSVIDLCSLSFPPIFEGITDSALWFSHTNFSLHFSSLDVFCTEPDFKKCLKELHVAVVANFRFGGLCSYQ